MLSLGKIGLFRKRKSGRGSIAKKQKEKFARSLAASSVFVGLMMVFYNFYPVFASPPSTPYAPGETTDPSCAPGDTNCTVHAPLTTTLTTSTAIIMGTSSLRFAYDSSNYAAFNIASDGSLAISSSSGANLLRVMANGNIGIGTSTPAEKLSVVGNISNVIGASTTMSEVGTLVLGGAPYAVNVSGKYAYVVQYNSSSLSVVDVSNPLNPVRISTTSVGSTPGAITVSGRYAYIANYTGSNMSSTVSVVDISNPYAPREVAIVSTSRSLSLFATGRYLYVLGYHSSNLDVVDISNPLNPVHISKVNMDEPLNSLLGGVFVSGRYAYVAGGHSASLKGKFLIFDVSDPFLPLLVTTSLFGDFFNVNVTGRYAYVSNYASNTMAVIDVSNPLVPVQVATTSVGTGPQSLTVSGRYAYIANTGSNDLSVVDISIPTSPRLIKNIPVGLYPTSVYVSGRYAYVANVDAHTLSIIDISGTEVTSLMAHSAEVGNLQSRNDILAQGNIMAGTSLMVGAGGIFSQGALSVFASSTGVTSSIFSIDSAARQNIFKTFASGRITIGTSSPLAKLTLQGTGLENPLSIVSSSPSISSMFTILTNGKVGIGTSTPTYTLSVTGTVGLANLPALSGATANLVCWNPDGQLTTQATNCTISSARFKENIQSLSSAELLNKVNALRAVSFDWKDGHIPASGSGLGGGGKESSGFIAEEVALIDPMLVVYTDSYTLDQLAFVQANYPSSTLSIDGKILIPQTVDYSRVSVLLTGALQDVDARLAEFGSPIIASEAEEYIMPNFATVILDKFTLIVKNSLRKLGLIIKNGVATVKELFADKITTQELCVGSVCVNESQLQDLLQQANSSTGGSSGSGVIIESPPEPVVEDIFTPTTTATSTVESSEQVIPSVLETTTDLIASSTSVETVETSSSSTP